MAEVQFNDDYLTLLQKNNILGLCLNVLCDCLAVVEQQSAEASKNVDTASKIVEASLLASSFLNIVRTFHVVSSKTSVGNVVNVDGNKNMSFAVCNMFIDENGTVAVEKTLEMITAAVLEDDQVSPL